MGTSAPVRASTTMCSTVGASLTAPSAITLSGTRPPLRQASSWVTSSFAPVDSSRSPSASAENPPNTTTCGAPMRAQASIATGELGHHAHVDADDVALADPQLAQRVREPAHVGEQVGEGDRAVVLALRLGDEVVGDLVAPTGLDVAVEAVDR